INTCATSYTLPNGIVVTASGRYTSVLKNAQGCDSTIITNLDLTAGVNLNTKNPAPICGVGSIDLTAPNITEGSDPGLQYTYWMNATTTQAVANPKAVGAGTYYIKATATNGCYTVKAVDVTLSTTPNATITGGNICLGQNATVNIQLNGAPPFTLTYTDGTITTTLANITSPYQLVVSPIATTTYTILNITDAKCTNNSPNASTRVVVEQLAKAMRYPTVVVQPNKFVQLNARYFSANHTYNWNPTVGLNGYGQQNPIFKYDKETEYKIEITSANGCITVDTLLVIMRERSPLSLISDIFVPKAWSPNRDGHNDKLFPLTVNIRKINYFRIFNRWGQLMFETNIIGHGWDGIFKGQPQVSDVYTWTLEAIGEDDKYYKRSGNSILLR
ncbi:MAG: T9SS type B sorting domain-containing protein, partial [Chitinophagaceae bacterium]